MPSKDLKRILGGGPGKKTYGYQRQHSMWEAQEEGGHRERVCRSGVKTRKSESHRRAATVFSVLLTLTQAAFKAVLREGKEEATG